MVPGKLPRCMIDILLMLFNHIIELFFVFNNILELFLLDAKCHFPSINDAGMLYNYSIIYSFICYKTIIYKNLSGLSFVYFIHFPGDRG